jgi:hypothetical protein
MQVRLGAASLPHMPMHAINTFMLILRTTNITTVTLLAIPMEVRPCIPTAAECILTCPQVPLVKGLPGAVC